MRKRKKKKKSARTQGFTPYGSQGYWDAPNHALGPGFNPYQSIPPFQGMFSGMNALSKSGGGTKPQIIQPVNIWEQIGGLDGIITNMGKVKKIMQMAQSITPFMKIFKGM